jgi:ABC-type nitrate/sulfonate/bicarbonate transport system permease component
MSRRTTRTVPAQRSHGRPPVRGLLPLVVLLVVWQVVMAGKTSVYFSPPSTWVSGLRKLLPGGQLWHAIGQTVEIWLLAMVIAAVLGSALGVLIGRWRACDQTLGPFLEFCRVLPGAAVVPIVVLLAGYTARMQLFVVVFGGIWPVLLEVRAAAQRLRPQLLDVGRSLRLSRSEVIRKLVFPSILPGILVGIRIAAPILLVLTFLVEILTSIGGLGALMIVAQQDFQSGELYGLVAIGGILGLLASWGIGELDRLAQRYQLHH